jgi:hypothetical protein
MPATDAYLLDNFQCKTDSVDTRNGYTEHATGLGGEVKTLARYSGSVPKLLGFADGSIFNVTAVGAVGAALATGRTEDEVQTTMFSNAAGVQWMIGVNGADNPFSFDGTSIASLTITGCDNGDNSLVNVLVHKGRLFFSAFNELNLYYLAPGDIQGAASKFDLSQICSEGGEIMAIGSITRDGGNGPDDYLVAVTDQGEVIVYQGIDPASSDTWSLVGKYKTATPAGRKCLFKYGGDLILITGSGLIPLSKLMSGEEFVVGRDSLSAKLGSALTRYIAQTSTHGWQAVLHDTSQMLLFNVPVGNGEYVQFIMNTITGAWSRFTDWNGACWEVAQGALYFGGADGKVYQADNGADDNGEDIRCNAKQAYSYFDTPFLKHFHDARLLFAFTGTAPVSATFNTDFKDNVPQYQSAPTGDDGSEWDTSDWDVAEWAPDEETQMLWLTLDAMCRAGSLWLRLLTNGASFKWYATEYLFEKGGIV